MKRVASVILLVTLGVAVVSLAVVAYHGPTKAANPRRDYSQADQPPSQVLSATTSNKSPAPTTTMTTVNTSATASQPTSTNLATTSNSNSAASQTTVTTQKTTIQVNPSVTKATSKETISPAPKPSLVQGLVDVLSNIQM